MKKLLLIVFVVCTTFTLSSAQDKYLSISLGYTNPLGDFAKSELVDESSGFAKSGYNFSFEMMLFINDFVGFGANLRFNNCKYDSELFNLLLDDLFQDQFDSIQLSSGNYNLHNFLFGPYVKKDIGDFVSIYAKTFIGVMTTYRPDQKLDYRTTQLAPSQTLETTGELSGSFAYNFGAGVLFKFNKKLGINISADYIAGNPKFEDFDYSELTIVKKKQSISYFNYNAGLLLTF